MKAVRITLIIVGVLIIMLIVGVVFFIKTFDPNKYKAQITQQLGKALQTDVQLGNIDFQFSLKSGLILNVEDTAIASKGLMEGIGLNIDEIQLSVDLESLFRKRMIVVGAINFKHPVVQIDINAKKTQANEEKNNFANVPKKSETYDVQGFIEQLRVQSIGVSQGEILLLADGENFVQDIQVTDLDAVVEGLVFDSVSKTTMEPFSFRMDCDIFGEHDMLVVEGLGRINGKAVQIRLDDTVIRSVLSQGLSLKAIQTFPALERSGIQGFHGIFEGTITQMILSPKELPILTFQGSLKEGMVETTSLPETIENVNVSFEYSDFNLDIHDSGADIAGGEITFSGRVEDILKTQIFSLKTAFNDININPFADQFQRSVTLEGKVSGTGNFQGAGFLLTDLFRNLQADAEVLMKDGKIVDFNLLNFIFNKISILPNLSERFEQALPEEYRKKVRVNQTVIEEATAKFNLKQGLVSYNTNIVTDVAKFDAQGTLDRKQNFLFDGALTLSAPLSQSLISEEKGFAALVNDEGQVVIPLANYRGPASLFRPLPDLGRLTKKVISSQLKDKARDLLKDAIGGEESDTSGSAETQNGSGEEPEKERTLEEDIVDTIFDSIF